MFSVVLHWSCCSLKMDLEHISRGKGEKDNTVCHDISACISQNTEPPNRYSNKKGKDEHKDLDM